MSYRRLCFLGERRRDSAEEEAAWSSKPSSISPSGQVSHRSERMGQAAERPGAHGADRSPERHRPSFGFNPLEFPICTRTPKRHGVLATWGGHVPFAMSLVAM